MYKPAQVELQLDRPQLPYSETLGPTIAGGSPAHYRRRQPNPIRKGPHRLSWDKVCVPKSDGGLGFQNLKAFNLALLTKQGWRLQINTHSLVHHVLKAHYFANSDFLHAKLGSKPSFAWWSIMAAQDVVKASNRWQVGDGSQFRYGLTSGCLHAPLFESPHQQVHFLRMHGFAFSLMMIRVNGKHAWFGNTSYQLMLMPSWEYQESEIPLRTA